jgi:hypothetical protein
MTTLIILVAAGLLSFSVLVYVVRGQVSSATSLARLHESTTHVDLDAFRNLLDLQNEDFFRARLDDDQFRFLQKQRDQVALVYLRSIATNASVVLQVSEPLRSSPSEATRLAAERAVAVALRLRINSLLAMIRLQFFLSFPIWRNRSTRIVMDYPSFVTAVKSLVMLAAPSQTSSILSAL